MAAKELTARVVAESTANSHNKQSHGFLSTAQVAHDTCVRSRAP
jgi:hypothetical protein